MERREDALAAIQESVELYQTLANERPAVYNTDLSHSLDIVHFRLPDLSNGEALNME
jgi:hypothetical protein